jgi:ABC-2 type transport system ATP-binding protein
MMEQIIQVNHLRKVYGSTVAVDDVSLAVNKGEIFGILGPNGAGKTTTIESIMGLRKPDGGTIKVLGLDPQKDRIALAQRIGIQLQEAAIPQRLKVWETIDLFASFYETTVPWEPLLEQWGLADKRNTYFQNLSGGQKQRLFIILALVNDPEVVFLDELTTGLDPQARRNTWELVEAIREEGKTVVLVTHFMD